jgi:transcriptional regulator of acetoin/glycerol metabolism
VALHPQAEVLTAAMWPDPTPPGPRTGDGAGDDRARASQEIDPEAFLVALRENQGNVKQTAAALGISRGRAYRLIEQIDSLDLDGMRRPVPGRPTPGN